MLRNSEPDEGQKPKRRGEERWVTDTFGTPFPYVPKAAAGPGTPMRPLGLSTKAQERGGKGPGYHAPHYGRPGHIGGSRPRDAGPVTADEAAARKHGEAKVGEPATTALVQRLSRAAGGEVHGLERRLKSTRSLARKIASDMLEKNITAQEAADAISDHLRYTTLFGPEEFVPSVLEVQAHLRAEGWEKYDQKFKNFWQPGDAYDGYNTVYIHTETGMRFEWQFHTPESIRIKEEIHVYYQKARVMEPGAERTYALQQMVSAWKTGYEKPRGWERLPGLMMGVRA